MWLVKKLFVNIERRPVSGWLLITGWSTGGNFFEFSLWLFSSLNRVDGPNIFV